MVSEQVTTQQAADILGRVDRRSRLADMTRQAAEDGLYETTAEQYAEALAAARHES